MTNKSVVVKIDFKTTKEKKELMKSHAIKQGVTVSYLMNELVNSYLQGNSYIIKRKDISLHLVKAIQISNYIDDDNIKTMLQNELEDLQRCLM